MRDSCLVALTLTNRSGFSGPHLKVGREGRGPSLQSTRAEMLKTTYRPALKEAPPPLPPGWTEHKAPTGHIYYYNAETKQSTYTRPTAPEELKIDYGATEPDREVQASISALAEFHKHNDPTQPAPGHFTGGRSYQDRSRPNRQGDRPKSKSPIANCAPWVLVKTKYGRRFVHNTETKESLWKFPSEVMMAVIEMDRLEWEKKKTDDKTQTGTTQEQPAHQPPSETQPYDSDEYEEVEVTDSEAEDQANKRPRLDPEQPNPGPQELDEDDIAYQLAAMEDDPGYDYDDPEAPFGFSDDDDDDDGGAPLTQADREALFRSLLDEHSISPFSTFDALIDTNTPTALALIADPRWTSLPNMSTRRTVFDTWSKDRVAQRSAAAAETSTGSTKADPLVAYLQFLSVNATPKLYWPEFKRKFRKEAVMADRRVADKDREKLYREYIPKLKLGESERRKEFAAVLKSVAKEDWKDGNPPAAVERDVRFYAVRDERSRKELVDVFLGR